MASSKGKKKSSLIDLSKPRSRRVEGKLSGEASLIAAWARAVVEAGTCFEKDAWAKLIALRVIRLLEKERHQCIHDAIDYLLGKEELEACMLLADVAESAVETLPLMIEDQPWVGLMITIPLGVWSRFHIPSGKLPAAEVEALWADLQGTVLASGTKFLAVPHLYSLYQLPRGCKLLQLVRQIAAALSLNRPLKLEETEEEVLLKPPEVLAEERFLLGMVAAPVGEPVFCWQELGKKELRAGQTVAPIRDQCEETWREKAAPRVRAWLPGCGFECFLPNGLHHSVREAEKSTRVLSVRAMLHYMRYATGSEAESQKTLATVAPVGAGGQDAQEYRISLTLGDQLRLIFGVSWPLLGDESGNSPEDQMETLRRVLLDECGVTACLFWRDVSEPEVCEDCGVDLYPDPSKKGAFMHPEIPEEGTEEGGVRFH